MSAKAAEIFDEEWEFPPEMKRNPRAEARVKALLRNSDELPPEPQSPVKQGKQARSLKPFKPASPSSRIDMEVIFVGGALSEANKAIDEHRAPVRARHLRSIDDLLAHVENHDVDCAVVDQSRPTESRGLKLALLAAANRVKHLVVLAEPKSCAEIEAIHGVHQVLRAPVSQAELIDVVVTHVSAVTAPKVPAQVRRLAERNARNVAAQMPGSTETASRAGRFSSLRQMAGAAASRVTASAAGRVKLHKLPPLSVPRQNRWLALGLAPLLAACICFAALVAFFLFSGNWSMPVVLSQQHELVKATAARLDELDARQRNIEASLEAASAAMAAATASKQSAQQQITFTRQTIDSELLQQRKLLRETRAHIARLDNILTGAGSGRQQPDSLVTMAALQSMHQLAMVTNEQAVKQIEADRLRARISYLESLRTGPAQAVMNTAPSAGAELAYLAQEIASGQARLSESGRIIASKAAEAAELRATLSAVAGEAAGLRASPAGRAASGAVTVLFVPDANAGSFNSGSNLYSCALLIVLCRQTGTAGTAFGGQVQVAHPLFGQPVAGQYVELADDGAAMKAGSLVHAGRPPLMF
ncbi:MAG: hypothetical protein V2I51_10375 [Anderseniella sp.]|jgi:hypothetical protein|nr:hypothetical protein [Anderseniella sp.]